MSGPWGERLRLHYRWQALVPDPVAGGQGWILYDAGRGVYRLHNDFHDGRRLDYLLHEDEGLAWVAEWRAGAWHCSRHETDRRVRLHRHPVEGHVLGEAELEGDPVRVIEYREPGHDRWIWYLDVHDRPRRFLVWTHHGRILVDHVVESLEIDTPIAERELQPDPAWGCAQSD